MNSLNDYSHVVEISEKNRVLQIFRLYRDGSRVIFTEVELPKTTFEENEKMFRELAQKLGENILADSPVARKNFDI